MRDYANKADKEIIVVLAGCIGYADVLKDLDFRNSENAKCSLAEMRNNASKALDAVTEGLNPKQIEGLKRFANGMELMCVPKHSPASKKGLLHVSCGCIRQADGRCGKRLRVLRQGRQ